MKSELGMEINIKICFLVSKSRERYRDDDGWSGNFVTYFLLFTLFVVIGYLILHNKNKVSNYSFF